MAASLTEEELARLEALEAAATPGPWRSMRDGNQYINTRFLPTAKLVGASRLDGVTRPWNPNKYVTFGFKPEEFETARFKDADADFIAAMRNALPALLKAARAVRNVEAAIRELRAEYRLGPVKRKDGTDTTPVDLPRHLLDRVETALTATTEPTGGEEKR